MSKQKYIRTCLVCGAKQNLYQPFLRRFVWSSNAPHIRFDTDKKQAGRGGYVCANKVCEQKIETAKLQKKVKHFLRVSI